MSAHHSSVRPVICKAIYTSVQPYVRPSTRPSLRPSVRLPVCSSTRPSVRPTVRGSVRPSVEPVRPSACPVRSHVLPSLRLSVRLTARPSVSVHPSASVRPSVRLSIRPSGSVIPSPSIRSHTPVQRSSALRPSCPLVLPGARRESITRYYSIQLLTYLCNAGACRARAGSMGRRPGTRGQPRDAGRSAPARHARAE